MNGARSLPERASLLALLASAAALAVAASSCGGSSSCKPGTLLVAVTLEGAAVRADLLLVSVSVDGATPAAASSGHSPGQAETTVQVDFPGGDPAGKSVAVTVFASAGGTPVGSGAATGTLMGGCATVMIRVAEDASDAGAESGAGDALGMERDGPPDAGDGGAPDARADGAPPDAPPDVGQADVASDLGADDAPDSSVSDERPDAADVAPDAPTPDAPTPDAPAPDAPAPDAPMPDGQKDARSADRPPDGCRIALDFEPPIQNVAGAYPLSITSADFDRDGILDVAVAENGQNGPGMQLGNGDGTFRPPFERSDSGAPTSLAVADFNGDGKLDLAVGLSSLESVWVFLGMGDGTFGPNNVFPATAGSLAVAAGDVNGDAKVDLVLVGGGSTGDTFGVLLGDGGGSFAPGPTKLVGNTPVGIALGDVNHDGKLDAVVADFTRGAIVLLGDGSGAFRATQTVGAPTPPEAVVLADVDQDGNLDICASEQSNGVFVALGNGTGFQPEREFATGRRPNWVAAGDLTGDGLPDLVVTNSGPNTVSVLVATGGGGFQPQQTFPIDGSVLSVTAGDFNGDGRIDLAVTTTNPDAINVLLARAPTLQCP